MQVAYDECKSNRWRRETEKEMGIIFFYVCSISVQASLGQINTEVRRKSDCVPCDFPQDKLFTVIDSASTVHPFCLLALCTGFVYISAKAYCLYLPDAQAEHQSLAFLKAFSALAKKWTTVILRLRIYRTALLKIFSIATIFYLFCWCPTGKGEVRLNPPPRISHTLLFL